MTQQITVWLVAGCIAGTLWLDWPASAKDAVDAAPKGSSFSVANSVRDTLQRLQPFGSSLLTSQAVGIQFSVLSVDAQAADDVFFGSKNEFETLVQKLAPQTELRVEEAQQVFSWNRIVRTSLIPILLEEVERMSPDASLSIIATPHVVTLLGRERSLEMAIPTSGPLLAAGTADPEFSGLERLRLTPTLPSSNRIRIESVFVLRQKAAEHADVPEFNVRSTKTLLHEDQSVAILLREAEDSTRALLVFMTSGQAKQVVAEQGTRGKPEVGNNDTPEPASQNAKLIKEIRELRKLIQSVRGDVLKLRSALKQQVTEASQPREPLEPDGGQSTTEAIHAQIEQALDQSVEIDATEMPLKDVLQQLSQAANINVVVDTTALEEEGFTVEHPVTITVRGVSLKSVLKLLLHDLKLNWVVEDEVLKITSQLRSEGKLTVQAYRAPELTGQETDREERLDRLKDLITATVAPDSWSEVGGPATIGVFARGNSLVIRQTRDVHDQIYVLLQSLTRLMDAQSPDNVRSVVPRNSLGQSRIPVEVIDRLQIEKLPNGLKRPIVVVESPLEDPRGPSLLRDNPRRRSTGQPLQVDSGKPQTSAVTKLPPVRVSSGRYLNISPQTVALVVRSYTPSRKLLLKLLADGEPEPEAARKLVEHIRSSINPSSWKSADVQAEVVINNTVRIGIRHTPGTHDRIRRLLERMEAEVKVDEPDDEADTGQTTTND